MILILTNGNDDHSSIVIESLKNCDARFFRFNTESFPVEARASLRFDEAQGMHLSLDGNTLNLDEVSTVWNRRPAAPVFPSQISVQDREFAAGESAHVLKSLWHLLADRFWVNSYEQSLAAEYKPYQLSVARQVGLKVPRTLITNDPVEAIRFSDECGDSIVYKGFTSYSRPTADGHFLTVYTNRISKKDLISRADSIKVAPCLFQEYIEKKIELRITVVGEQLFVAEIDSQKNARTREDWRRYDFNPSLYRPGQLPNDIRQMIHNFMRRLGLAFGCLDFIVTPEGDFIFLEINPNGQWYWVEMLTGLPILASFSELLVRGK